MSIIKDDPELMTILMGAGAAHLMKFAAPPMVMARPPTPAEDPQVQQQRRTILPYRIAIPLLVNLQRQIEPEKSLPKAVPIGTQDPNANLDATVTNLRSLGDFITWAAEKKLTWQGKRFAWTPAEEAEARQAGAWNFTSLPYDRGNRDTATREPVTVSAYALKPELTDYLKYLRGYAVQSNNKVLQVMIGKIIGEINTFLRAAGESAMDAREKPAQRKSDLNEDSIVDGFTSDVLDKDRWNDGIDAFPKFISHNITKTLKVKDISNQGAFFSWLRTMRVKNKDNTLLSAIDPNGDPCLAVHILYKRSNYLGTVGQAGDAQKANYSKMVDMYKKAVMDYGSQLQMNGKPCAVTEPGVKGATQGAGGSATTGKDGVAGGADAAQVQSVLYNIMQQNALPLDTRNIDFDRIKKFFELLSSILGKGNEAAVQRANSIKQLIAQTEQAMWDAHRQLKSPMNQFAMDGGLDQITPLLAENANPLHFIGYLQRIVKLTQQVLLQFQASYQQQLGERASLLQQQIGPIFTSNWQRLGIWSNTAQSATHIRH